ncbi:ClpP/crotonase [Cryphonectria parasitica EP155]|uniref:3-hydroxyisobutyryl-CoA hydrolase n=1 Tax=Cryphonectria parasitica (strain ATCC 38755 / EP155) TaxID=660469 RepID=A0A9P4YCP7_CRYP1|nr:ClpP/crotonase [Cryphonectria parasitica EP155]KAF3770941.1 ClpP/crotonase [Cryphonectria parasitica EP155]
MSPLRVKIQVPEDTIWKPVEGDEPEDVVFNSIYGLRTIELNRPKKLNSLNGSMIRKIAPRLIEWQESDMANVIVMKGAGNALCAGGDVAALAKDNQHGKQGQKRSDAYFALEYKLDHLIATLTKPYIAFMDGFTMGGGVGLSIHAPFRIATERTVFAMPETTIGFFPDVGASFFLPRLPGAVGTYLALTSERLEGVNAFYAGIATHYLHSTTLPMLEGRLAELRFRDFDPLEKRLHLINDAIEEYTTGLPHDQPILLGGELRKAIDRCFSRATVDEIIQALKEEPEGPTKQWADQTLATLHARSPTSVHVALKQMQRSREQKWSIADTFKREHQIAAKFMRHPDFVEGVSAQLIRKDRKPVWQPASLEDIREEDKIAEPFFEITPQVAPLQLLTREDYPEYPWRRFGLPTEDEVKQVVKSKNYTANQVCNAFAAQRNGKQGIREVVAEIVARNTRTKEKSMYKIDGMM